MQVNQRIVLTQYTVKYNICYCNIKSVKKRSIDRYFKNPRLIFVNIYKCVVRCAPLQNFKCVIYIYFWLYSKYYMVDTWFTVICCLFAAAKTIDRCCRNVRETYDVVERKNVNPLLKNVCNVALLLTRSTYFYLVRKVCGGIQNPSSRHIGCAMNQTNFGHNQ